MKQILLLTLIVSILACGDSKSKLFDDIKALEQSDKLGSPEVLEELAVLHKTYGLKYKDSLANNYLYAAAMYYYYGGDTEESKALLEEYSSRDDSTDRAKNALLNLGQIYAKEENYAGMNTAIDQALKIKNPTTTQWHDILNVYSDKIEKQADLEGKDFEQQALCFTAMAMYNPAIEALQKGVEGFMNYENRANMIYRAGFISWEYLNDTQKAKEFYEQFLKEYPEHELAAEVSKILNSGMLEMTDEEILEMLKGNS